MKEYAICTRKQVMDDEKGWPGIKEVSFQVRILAEAEGYAMVRRRGAMPFVCDCKQLSNRYKA